MKLLKNSVLLFTTLILVVSCSDVKFGSKKSSSDSAANTPGNGPRVPECEGSVCPTATYSWYQGGFNACSKPCGSGVQTQTVECRDQNEVVVADSFCTGPKPPTSRACNVQSCPGTYAWNIGEYGDCSKTCGGGTKTRAVICQNQNGSNVADSLCPQPKPATSASCNNDDCPPQITYAWQVTPGLCSKECGGGTATDVVICKRNDGATVDDTLCTATKPPTTRTCNTQDCPVNYTYAWEPQPWTACSKTCGGGTQTRAVACKRNDGAYVSTSYCDAATKPATSQACSTNSCPTGRTVTQNLFVTPALNAVDVILVIDDSSSMKEDQSKLANRMNGLISDLESLKVDYQVCITSTDNKYYAGSPIKWSGTNSVIMNKSTPNKNKVFVNTINSLGAEWSSDERGIRAVNLMLANFKNTGCMRAESTLTTILISDEDERSVGGNKSLSNTQYEPLEASDMPNNLIANIHKAFDKTGYVKPFLWNSIIVKPGDTSCMAIQDAQSSPAFYGKLYAELSNKTGGYTGSICASDYTNNLKIIKERTVNSMPGMKLQCVPLSNPTVTFDKPVSTTVTLAGDELKFSPVVPEGVTIRAVYTCP